MASYFKKPEEKEEIIEDDALSQKSYTSTKIDLEYKPTGTTNYIACYFDEKLDDRIILLDGGLPFHEFIRDCYEFFEDYINKGNINRMYYLFACSSHSYNILYELKPDSDKDARKKNVKDMIEDFYTTMKDTFVYFNYTKNKYRDDTTMVTLKRSWKLFNETVFPKIKALF